MDAVAEQYYTLFLRMGIPATAVYLLMFNSGGRIESAGLNIAALAQNFVESLFKKRAFEEERMTDYTNRVDLFSFVAF